jgi:signal transduction histidine kinase
MAEPTQETPTIQDILFRSVSDGILVAASDLSLKAINPAAAALLGEAPENVIGHPVKQIFRLRPALVNLFSREGDQTLDVHLPRRRLAVGIGTSLANGERIVILQDVTESRDLDNRREALIKAIRHDLRNPISAMTGFADLVAKFGDLNEHQQKFLTRIRQTSSKLHDVIGSLVDLAWIEAGMPLEHKPLQLREIINAAVDRVASLAAESRVVIATSVQNPMPTVMGDPERLEQAIYHLLHNAVSYSYPEQTVVIHGWGDDHEIYCSVADRGIGIGDDELDLVFDRLYRSQAEYVRNLPGGGLGLTLTRTIIKRHGGEIWAASNLGEGSTFTFVLPVVDV